MGHLLLNAKADARPGLLFNPVLVWLMKAAEMPVNQLGWGTYPSSASLHAGHWAEEPPSLAREPGRYYLGCRGFAGIRRPVGAGGEVADEGDRAFCSRKDP